jgi:hypothetical protein
MIITAEQVMTIMNNFDYDRNVVMKKSIDNRDMILCDGSDSDNTSLITI